MNSNKKLFLNQMIWKVFMTKILGSGMSILMDGDEGGSCAWFLIQSVYIRAEILKL